jgi:hypothetical protein
VNVRDLIASLSTLDPELPVILAKDAEGNDFSPLTEAEPGMYFADTTWCGYRYPTPEQIRADPSLNEEDDGAPDDAVRAVFLWPVN